MSGHFLIKNRVSPTRSSSSAYSASFDCAFDAIHPVKNMGVRKYMDCCFFRGFVLGSFLAVSKPISAEAYFVEFCIKGFLRSVELCRPATSCVDESPTLGVDK